MSYPILFITACAQNVFLRCKCKRQSLTPLANSRLSNLLFPDVAGQKLLKWPLLHGAIQRIKVAHFLWTAVHIAVSSDVLC